jgi:hypothetical protein
MLIEISLKVVELWDDNVITILSDYPKGNETYEKSVLMT